MESMGFRSMSFLGSGKKHSEGPPDLIGRMALRASGVFGKGRRTLRLQLGSRVHMGTPGQVGGHFRETCGPEPSSVD